MAPNLKNPHAYGPKSQPQAHTLQQSSEQQAHFLSKVFTPLK